MREITKIKFAVTAASGQEVGTRDNRLGLQGFGGRVRAGLGRNRGGHRGFQIHGDNGNHFSTRGLYIKRAVISASDLSWDAKKKRACTAVAGCGVQFRDSKNLATELEEKRVTGNMKRSGHRRTWLENEHLDPGVDSKSIVARGLQRELVRMKETENSDANILGDGIGIKDQSEQQEQDASARHATTLPSGAAFGPR